ncbi:hypothetical protein RvY_09941 [Ramazzottius varieornatus]|uniref:Uncharacterized protein n=1 Tax=Ramazzottius varieornatus TaxID=947166 RepID=A0A1D1VIW9_RAMVA|nr:hypothetical protein RvY_09941 [Ramazzottius varieornatus]
MTSHIGDRVLMENLRCDVLDIEETIQKLLKRKDISKSLNSHRSWKYTGSYVLDVDTENLVTCFQYNPRNADQSQKGHLTLLELLIDRIGTTLLAFGVFIQSRQVSPPKQRLKVCLDRNLLVAATEILNWRIEQFFQAWGIGLPPEPETRSEEGQTSDPYRPNEPCPSCSTKKVVQEDVIQSISLGLQCNKEDIAQNSPLLKAKLSALSASEADIQAQEKKLKQEEAKLSANLSSMNAELSTCDTQLINKKADFEKVRLHTEDQLKKLSDLASEVESTSASTGNLDLAISNIYQAVGDINRQIDELEGSLSSAKSTRSTRDLNHMESRVDVQSKITANTQLLSSLSDQLSCFQQTYDPSWQQKLAQSEEKRASLVALWGDSQDRQNRNEYHMRELDAVFAQENSLREKLLAELRTFDTSVA